MYEFEQLSTTTTCKPLTRSSKVTIEPINPAPPVTRMHVPSPKSPPPLPSPLTTLVPFAIREDIYSILPFLLLLSGGLI